MSEHSWIEGLSDDDVAFIKRFVLASGSLKAVAQSYSVSYPTVRLRLDRLIQKIQLVDEHTASGAFEQRLRVLAVEGKVDPAVVRELMEAHTRDLADRGESRNARRGKGDG